MSGPPPDQRVGGGPRGGALGDGGLVECLDRAGGPPDEVRLGALQFSQRRGRLRQLSYRLEGHILVAAASRQIGEVTGGSGATYEALHPHFVLPADPGALYAALADTVYARWVDLEGPGNGVAAPAIWRRAGEIVAALGSVADARRAAEFLEVPLTVTP